MQYLTTIPLLMLCIFITSGCSWHLSHFTKIPDQMKTIIFDSSDPNSFLSLIIRKQLRLHGIKLVRKNSLNQQEIPSLQIFTPHLSQNAISIFQDGNIAEYQMIIVFNANVLVPGRDAYPIHIQMSHSFFDNLPQKTLSKDVKQKFFINEIYEKIAEEVIKKLLSIPIESKENIYQKTLKKRCYSSCTPHSIE